MPIQMVCDSTTSLVSAAIRDALHSTGGTTNGRTVGLGYGTASTSNGVTVNGAGTSSTQTPTKQQIPFRRTLAPQIDNDYDQYDEPEDGGPNDLVESISQSLRQGQQVKPITYEEGPSYSTSLDKLKSKYIVLKAVPLTDSTASGGSLSNSNSSSSSFGAGLSKVSAGGASNTLLNMNGGSLKFAATTSPSTSTAKSSTNVLQHQQNGVPASASSTATGRMDTTNNTNTLPTPKRTLFPRENVQIGWKTTGRKWLVGAGMMNMGNTCYLNSTLQALFHVPAIANWLLSDEPHRIKCDDGGSGGSCIICAMAKTLLESQTNQTAFRPYLVYSKLRLVCKHLVPGRQEDAHEFLRYLVEAMEKSYLNRTKNSKELDQYSKETTPLNQILGGYLRSEVKCLSCQHVSTTFQHFEDLLLDIRKANSIDEALELYFARERLEEMGYKCEACKRRVAATKQFSLERAPFVLCIQLKRFSMLSGKINKHVELRSKLDLTPYSSPVMRTNGGKLTYRLTSMVTHLGSTQHCGHYTAIGHTDAAGYHVFDDSSVRPIGIHNVMSTNAYILFYELESVAAGAIGLPNGTCRPKATVTVGQPSSTATLTSMGHLSNGTTPTGLGGTASSGTGGNTGGGGGGGSGGTPGKVTNSSPLRVLGTGGANGSTGNLFPSKLEQKPSIIGPMLPTVTTPAAIISPSPAPLSTTTVASKGATTTTTSVTSSASASGREISNFSSPSSTASTLSNPSPLSSPLKQQDAVTGSKIPKLPDINSRHTTPFNGAHGEVKVKSLSTPLLASMPMLNSPTKSMDSSSATNGCPSAVISLVPYDSDDTSSTSEDEHEPPNHSKSPAKSLVLTNGGGVGKRAKQQLPFANGKRGVTHNKAEGHVQQAEDDEDDEEEEERTSTASSRSPQMIKTKAGLWKVSQSSTADQLSYPDSGSASSSKSSSPTTSGVSSPTSSPGQQKQQKLPLKSVGVVSAGGEPTSLSNGHNRPAHNNNNNNNGINGKSNNKSALNGYHTNGAAVRAVSPGGDGKGGGSVGGSSAVQMLMKYSHRGYGAPVKSWNGQQTVMERELANDRREERKRQIEEDRETEMDRGRVKKTKGGGAPPTVASGAGGNNLFQQYQNHQTTGGNGGNGGGGGGGKWMGNGGPRNHFHNHHQNNYRGGGGGGGYYQNGHGNRHHGGGGASGRFRTGGRRFGGRNGGGFHTKAHHHHQRNEQGSGMASGGGSGGGSNGFYR